MNPRAATAARVLFQTLIASATRSLYITTPYLLPDHGLRDEIARAAHERHVDVRIVVPGKRNDHRTVYYASRRIYGDLLRAGVRIYEYDRSMNHTKALTVDGLWAVVGSTNMDTRSFGRERGSARPGRRAPDRAGLSHRCGPEPVGLLRRGQRRGPLARIAEWASSAFERQE